MSDAQCSTLRALFDRAVAVADPVLVLPDHLPPRPAGRVAVVGAGKGSARMAEAVEAAWGPCDGLVVTRYGYGRPTRGIEIVEAAHPVPDAVGVEATQRILDLVKGSGEGDFVLALISGGASSLLCAPAPGMGLGDKQALHRALLASGAPIGQMNLVRKHFSAIKGGQLAAAAHPARMLSLMISDVPGDAPGEIGSGPTVGEGSDPSQAAEILSRYGIAVPAGRSSVLRPGDDRLSRCENRVIIAPSQSLDAARKLAEAQGFDVRILGDAIEGEAREEAARQVALARDIQAGLTSGDKPVLLLSGGECTVTGPGEGIGGPNAEFALAAALELAGQGGIWALSCDTDGVDGAAEVAGAVIAPDTLDRAAASGLDPAAALRAHDAHSFFAGLGDQVVTGPTLTNVNDFRAILIEPLKE